MEKHELPPPARMLQFIMGSWVAQAVGAAARLELADHLAAGPKTAEELGKLAGAAPDAVHRLMRALASLGVFEMTGDRFSLTPLGETLRTDVPGSMRNFAITETDDAHWLTWGKFSSAVTQGRALPQEALGMSIWEYYEKHPSDSEQFSRAMKDISGMATGPVLASYDFAEAGTIVDVGGALGALLVGVLQKYPAAKGVLFDRPQVIPGSTAAIEQAGMASRVEVVGGDFLEKVPAGGDVYLLKHILHDWDDAHCVTILQKVRAAMKPTSKILVVEFALPKGADPSPAHLMDLNMLALLDGRERTADEYGVLFAKAGLRLSRFIATPSPVGIAEAVPA